MNSGTNHAGALPNEITHLPITVPGVKQSPTTVATRMNFATSSEKVWEGLMFYEQIAKRPPLLLRVFLPAPIRAKGRKSEVGDEVTCQYVSGYLRKRVTRVTHGRSYAFEVIEQNLSLGGIRLAGGSYTLFPLPDGGTDVVLETLYHSSKRPRWLCARIEVVVCHLFHRHILRAMRSSLATG